MQQWGSTNATMSNSNGVYTFYTTFADQSLSLNLENTIQPKRKPKKYQVYVRNPKSGNIKKVSFGDVHGGLTAKVSNPEARKSFAARHKCSQQKDRTTAAYWACNLPRYAKSLGMSGGGNFYW